MSRALRQFQTQKPDRQPPSCHSYHERAASGVVGILGGAREMTEDQKTQAIQEEIRRCGRAEARAAGENLSIVKTYWEGRRDGLQEALRILTWPGYADNLLTA